MAQFTIFSKIPGVEEWGYKGSSLIEALHAFADKTKYNHWTQIPSDLLTKIVIEQEESWLLRLIRRERKEEVYGTL